MLMGRKRVFRGDRLETVRIAMEMTEEEFAVYVDMDQAQLNRYENHVSEPTAAIIVKLAQKLNITADYLLGLSSDPNKFLADDDLTDDGKVFKRLVEKKGAKRSIEILSKEE